MQQSHRNIITIRSSEQGDTPYIRQTQITVYDVLDWLTDGLSIAEIVNQFPELTETDIRACLEFAAEYSHYGLAVSRNETSRNETSRNETSRNETLFAPTPPKSSAPDSEPLTNPQQHVDYLVSSQASEQSPSTPQPSPLLKPFVWMEKRIWEPLLSWGENQALISLLGLLGNLGLIIAVVSYISLEKQRRDDQVYAAWQTITNAQGQSGNGGRILALEFLNASPGANWRLHFPWICISEDWLCSKWKPESLDGVDLAKAYLAGIQLPNASLVEANLEGAVLWGANLQGANLEEANLRGAKLGAANLEGVRLDETNFQGAFYSDEKTTRTLCVDITYPPVHPCPTRFPEGFDPESAGMKLLP
jgi:uncharacterized protein (DUF433 family)